MSGRAPGGFMSRRRLIFINAVLLLLLGVHLYENVVDGEHWPRPR